MADRDERGGATGVLLLLVLVLAVGGFGLWSSRRAARAEEVRAARGAADQPGEPLPPGWGAFVLGAPSGAEPMARHEALFDVVPAGEGDGASDPVHAVPRTEEEYELSPVSDFELVVEPGQVLSRIVQVYYGAAEPALVEGLAEYNGLSHPDKLRAGETIRLPSERRLRALVAEGR